MLQQNKNSAKHSQNISRTNHNASWLLAVGPLPPPPDGPSVCFKVFCNEIRHWADLGNIQVIDSSPRRLKDEQTRKISAANFAQAVRVLWPYCRQVIGADRVLIFGSNGFLLSMAPLLLGIAKLSRTPCYLRSFGGSLDRFDASLRPLFRQLLRFTLRHADGLIVETELLYDYFAALIGDKVHLVPGYRSLPASDDAPPNSVKEPTEELRLVFLGHVREEKGVLVLLESLRAFDSGTREIHCDIFGPVYDSFTEHFEQALTSTHNATYKGVLNPEEVIPTLRNYDAFVFPSYYQGEGHPGVVIEAMAAGIPAITTAFRSIPELVADRVNGLLIPPQDPNSLTEAIRTIYDDRQLLAQMAAKNWELRTRYDARRLVPLIVQPLGVEIQPISSAVTGEQKAAY